jgi:hypothetical protein
MPARRCSICAADWPHRDDFKKCPECGERTSPVSNIDAMDLREAMSRKRSAEFERFYEKWDATHPPERLEPAPLPALPAGSARPSPG